MLPSSSPKLTAVCWQPPPPPPPPGSPPLTHASPLAYLPPVLPITASSHPQALDQLAGTWKLMYTSSPQLTAVLALGKLPLVSVGEVTQRIDPENYTVENQVGVESVGGVKEKSGNVW